MKILFEFKNYRHYLLERLGGPRRRSGMRSKAAAAMRCHNAYVSLVLKGQADLSLEQAENLGRFLGHTEEENHFFYLLIQMERAATPGIKKYFQTQLDLVRSNRLLIKERIGAAKTLSEQDESLYYSAWYFAAIHVLLMIPKFQDRESLSKFLQLPVSKVASIIDFLNRTGLVENEGGRYRAGPTHIHLSHESPNISKHHMNWRTQAIVALDHQHAEDLHYSGVAAISEKDAHTIRERLLENLRQSVDTIKGSPEEEAYVYCFDFFKLR